jgi:hypothetical protein
MNVEYMLSQLLELEQERDGLADEQNKRFDTASSAASDEQYNRIAKLVGVDVANGIYDIIAQEDATLDVAFEEIACDIKQRTNDITEQIANIQTQITALVIEGAKSVKVPGIMALYAAGRVSWDTKALDGFAAGHPEIMPFRKVGQPSVSYRREK